MIMFKMEQLVVSISCIFFVFFKYCNAQTGNGIGLYSRRYEKIDVDTILSNPRLVTNYVDCLLNKRPCPPEGKDLKRILPEALRTKCGRCWPSQKEGALTVITRLYYDYPEHYSALRAKWDPTGEYHRRFEEYLRDKNFNLITSDDRDLQAAVQLVPFDTTTTTTTTTTTAPPPTSLRPSEIFPSRVFIPIPPQTQRPIRQDFNRQQETQDVFITNRFGDEGLELDDVTMKSPPPQRTPVLVSSQTQRIPTTQTSTRVANVMLPQQPQFTGTATNNVFQTRNPILNFINRLTNKFTTTTEIFVGMLKGNVNFKINKITMGGGEGNVGAGVGVVESL